METISLESLLGYHNLKQWSLEEEEFLIENPFLCPIELARGLHKKFGTNRSILLVDKQRSAILNGPVTDEEREFVKNNEHLSDEELTREVYNKFGMLRPRGCIRPSPYLKGPFKNQPKKDDRSIMEMIYDEPPF